MPEAEAPLRSRDLWRLAMRIVVVTAVVAIAAWAVVVLRGIVLQVVVAIILATGLGPLVDRLQRRGLPRGGAVLLIYLGLILALVFLGIMLVPPIVNQIDSVIAAAPTYGDRAIVWLHDLQVQFPFLPALDEQVLAQLRDLGSQVGALTSQALVVARFALRVLDAALSAILVLLLTLYLIVDGQRIRAYLLSFLGPRLALRAEPLADRMGERMGGWLLGQVALSLVVGIASFVGLTVLGVNNALLLAVIAAFGEVIPIVGPIASAVPAILVAATQSPLQALLTLGLYLGIQQLENNLLVPKIMEKAVNLHPLAVILSLLIGGELLGIIGAMVAVPVAAAAAVMLEEARRGRAGAPPEPAPSEPAPSEPAVVPRG